MIKRLASASLLLLLAACNGAGNSAATGGPATGRPSRGGDEDVAMMAPPAPGSMAPSALQGMSAAAVEHALGKPAFVRRDPPAEIWQYRVKLCTLDLFLYEDNGRTAVAHYAVRTPGGNSVSDRGCLDEVLARRDGTPTS
ncbi:hypothetical protein [Paramagnetospirillum magneticum]|uniref:Lipoprotein SmpA/OmlA domain-containing protein n=1 Tax=Paramagnetospirillum magneticum (strain ATCC 700264 / AMB-1) TaxID=342108 RepID=Q2VZI5_PARM1|nr:hypothetical protein [Paramagnetospirillum magneticum]BAE52990.1 hypothetical protein amb4186 [Paramagnetospirillum magneticum AMB-1]